MTAMNNLHGIVAMVIGMGMFIASDTVSRLAFATVPMFELMTIRAYVGAVLCLILIVLLDMGRHLPRLKNPWVLARGLCEVGANMGFTLAIYYMPIADVTAIAQTAPLLVLLGAWVLFGERLAPIHMALIALGFTGALLVAQPGGEAASPYAVLGFVVALSATARDLITRKVPAVVPAPVAALGVLICLTIASLIGMLLFETPVVPSARDTGLLVTAGALMIGGHVGVFLAYKLAKARAVAPFMYTLTIWAVLSGLLVFGEIPNALAIAGMALVLLAGLLVIYADGRGKRATGT